VGSEQLDCAVVGVTDNSCPGQDEQAAAEPCAIPGWLSRVFDLAPAQREAGQAGIPGHDAFLHQAIFQLKPDIRDQVLQVKPTDNTGTPKPYPMRINVRREPPTQDVADHARPARPGHSPRPHRCLISRLTDGGQVEPFPAARILDQRLLHRGQSAAGHLSDHPRTLTSQARSESASQELQWHHASKINRPTWSDPALLILGTST
jgi:hypothetical protein